MAMAIDAVPLLDDAVGSLVGLRRDVGVRAEAAAAADPTAVLPRCLLAYLSCYDMSPAALSRAARLVDEAPASLPEREAAHRAAARAWAAGDVRGAAAILAQWVAEAPRDLLALKVAQDLQLMAGRTKDLRDVVARALPAWSGDDPAYGRVLGMLAFGLEETGALGEAESVGEAALAAGDDDVWALHALVHVMDSGGRAATGDALLSSTAHQWGASILSVHHWWHAGLFALAELRTDEALEIYDGPLQPDDPTLALELVDASSLLWRLWLLGVDVGGRPRALADAWAARGGWGTSSFNDAHAAMAFALVGHHAVLGELAASTPGDAGRHFITAVAALAAGDSRRAVDALAPVRARTAGIGGSHAQRDVMDQTLLAAAARARHTVLIEELAAARPTPGHTEALITAWT
jgi:tetratricopeptide (TPR) repeat protein